MKVKVKKLTPTAIMPKRAHYNDAGADLYADSVEFDGHNNVVYTSGLAFEIPDGYVGLIFPRSSNAKKDLILSNCVGVIDSGYRGNVMAKFKIIPNDNLEFEMYELGERFAQIIIMPIPSVDFIESDVLSESSRGIGGYGSSGK